MRGKWIYWFGGWFFDFTKIIVIVLFCILIIHFFIATIIVVSGPSMEETHHDGDIIFIEKFSYWFDNPQRGDVVGIYFPSVGERRLIKRVIGLPGEKVEIKNGKVYINNTKLEESYLDSNIFTSPDAIIQLKNDEYFVMGDNREESLDSRNYGPLPKSALIGKKLFFIVNYKQFLH